MQKLPTDIELNLIKPEMSNIVKHGCHEYIGVGAIKTTSGYDRDDFANNLITVVCERKAFRRFVLYRKK